MSAVERYLDDRRRLVDEALERFLPPEDAPPVRLHEAMAYSVRAGGKRVRPILVIASAEACGGSAEAVMPTACALEFVHTYSLIHDDLPCMDDDDLRRGKPTSHKVFGETIAVLAGDALQALAFDLIARNAGAGGATPAAVVEVSGLVAAAAGPGGMVGGQAADCLAEGREVDEEELAFIHLRKTGALIRASVLSGAILAGADAGRREALGRYADSLGLLFQVVDDILNVVGTPEALGKAAGSDAERRKATYPGVVGLEAAKRRAETLCGEAKRALTGWGAGAEVLEGLAEYVLRRTA